MINFAAMEVPRNTITFTVSYGIPRELPLADLVNAHIQWWREHSRLPETDDELMAALDADEPATLN